MRGSEETKEMSLEGGGSQGRLDRRGGRALIEGKERREVGD